ncbi:Transcription factor Tfb2 [Fragilaria crotonensis]|nr:Transcription factor Tfb2 [Fragilaria crotonensis]KAI2492422.1 Transcription factor Tfb2 [Fragilaria crotonensis]
MADIEAKLKKKRISTSGVLDYLRTALPRSNLLELYIDESRGRFVCRAILQQLSDVGQQIVMRLACCGGSFPLGGQAGVQGVSDWVHQKQKLPHLLKELKKWGIIEKNGDDIMLTRQFNEGLQASIRSLDSSPWIALTPSEIINIANESGAKYKPITLADLDRHTQDQWDAVLHFLVGTPNVRQEPPQAVISFLEETGLMQPDPDFKGPADRAPLIITSSGYEFMLLDTHQQVWHFVVQYLQSLEGHKKANEFLAEAMLFLISLSFAKVGDAYSSSSLNKRGRSLMRDLSLFGLLYVRNLSEKCSIFYPTQIALQLVQDTSSNTSSLWSLSTKVLDAALAHPKPHDSSHLAIIVQTNFQLCAYTTSELHVSMLALFCDVNTIRRLPNVVFMIITRDSVKSAFSLGVKAEQILRFLEKHAHPKLRVDSGSSIPQNVEDQIWLWDRELRRLQWTEAWKCDCVSESEFNAVKSYSETIGAHTWSSKAKGSIYVDFSKAEEVQTFARQWRARNAAGGT